MKKGFKYVKSSGTIYRCIYDAQGNMRSVHIMPSGRVFKHFHTLPSAKVRPHTAADIDAIAQKMAELTLRTSHNIIYFQHL